MAPLERLSFAPQIAALEDLAWHARSICLLVLDAEGLIHAANEAACRTLQPLAMGGPIWRLLPDSGASVLRVLMKDARTAPVRGVLLNFSDGEHYALTLTCSIAWTAGSYVLLGEVLVEKDQEMKQELLDLTRELVESNRERAKVARELAGTLAELRTSHWHIQKIQEFLPACCVCNKVRTAPDQEGAVWQSLSSFLAENGLLMSHGYCPECEARAMAEIDAEFPFH